MPKNSIPLKEALFAEVALDQNVGRSLDYQIPLPLKNKIQIGSRVSVTLRGRSCSATVLKIHNNKRFPNILPIQNVLSSHLQLPADLLSLAKWMTQYYCCDMSQALRCIFSSRIRKDIQAKKQIFLSLVKSKVQMMKEIPTLRLKFPKQAAVLDLFLKESKGIFLKDLLKQANLSNSPIESLIKKKFLRAKKIEAPTDDLLENLDYFRSSSKQLTPEQKRCFDLIHKTLQEQKFHAHLIYGITGSGKTEIYLQLMEKAIQMGKNVLVLVPEIALTSQMIDRFRARFDHKIAVFHHKKSLSQRNRIWEGIQNNQYKIVLGARSCVFSPIKNLGLIIVDEEHDGSFKQDQESPYYHARDLAIMRASLSSACVVLGSATPSLESFCNAEKGKYTLSTLTTRPEAATLPKVHLVDMKSQWKKTGGFTHFCDLLIEKLVSRTEKGEQSLLFLNRRGYYTSFFCKECSHILKCPHCDLSLTYHKSSDLLVCHLCDFNMHKKSHCPECKSNLLQYKGFGTEHVEKSLNALFPNIRTLRIDRDIMKKKAATEQILKEFGSGKADVLIGTQMIAKGLHFPQVTLVGVLNADLSLNIPDFRSSERVFQLLTQVAGRSGRGDHPGEVVIQSFLPNHPVIQKAVKQDYLSFYKLEMKERKLFQFPPFYLLIKLTFSGLNEKKTLKFAEEFVAKLKPKLPSDTLVHPVCQSGHAKVKDRYRFQSLIRGKKILPLSKEIARLKRSFSLSSVRLSVDVNPLSTFF